MTSVRSANTIWAGVQLKNNVFFSVQTDCSKSVSIKNTSSSFRQFCSGVIIQSAKQGSVFISPSLGDGYGMVRRTTKGD